MKYVTDERKRYQAEHRKLTNIYTLSWQEIVRNHRQLKVIVKSLILAITKVLNFGDYVK